MKNNSFRLEKHNFSSKTKIWILTFFAVSRSFVELYGSIYHFGILKVSSIQKLKKIWVYFFWIRLYFYTFLRSTFELNWWNKCWQFLSTTILSELTTFPLSIVGEWVISVLNYFRIFGVVLCWSRERGLFKSSCLNFLAFLKLFRLT